MITPREALAHRSAADETTLAAMEKKIDQALTSYDGHRPVRIAVSICGCINAKVRDEIARRYQQAGWIVTCRCDSRDGDFWEFSAAGGATSDYWRDR